VNPWVERLARFGYVARGVLYIIVGVLAVEVALHAGGTTTTPRGAIGTIATLPAGKVLLVLTAIGLAGYGLWGFVRAILDPLHQGAKPAGLVKRCGYLASACTYTALVVPTVQLLLGSGDGGNGSASLVGRILGMPGGPWLVGIAGVIFLAGAGGGQFYEAATAHFRREFKSSELKPEQFRLVTIIGRIGMAARGVVFTMMGAFLIQAAVHTDAVRAKGLDGALQMLAAQPQGPALLGVVAAGLVCFGVYSVCCARWIRVT